MKRISIIAVLALALVLLYGGVAYANFGPHGGYSQDTDACAACHRAHTSFSPITWTDTYDNTTQHSALLISSATTMKEFCYACHGDAAPGASTNVQGGSFDAGPSWGNGSPAGSYPYTTNSTFDSPLNGGGFDRAYNPATSQFNVVTSKHDMDTASTVIVWGEGNSVANDTMSNLTCTDCHDPHGSSNYRLLKDSVNGRVVGGYTASDSPRPFVVSREQSYPTTGWALHEAGQLQMGAYRPNYTTEEYAYQPPAASGFRSMSVWCAACHTRYIVRDDSTSTAPAVNGTNDGLSVTGWNLAGGVWTDSGANLPGTYDYGSYEASGASELGTAAPGALAVGARSRHRHPVNLTLEAGRGGTRSLQREVLTDTLVPLEARLNSPNPRGSYDFQDYIGCLTCHFAHGTSATMTGWAESSLVTSPSATVTWYPELRPQPTTSGVNPTFDSALLRTNNRGVCERCHNK